MNDEEHINSIEKEISNLQIRIDEREQLIIQIKDIPRLMNGKLAVLHSTIGKWWAFKGMGSYSKIVSIKNEDSKSLVIERIYMSVRQTNYTRADAVRPRNEITITNQEHRVLKQHMGYSTVTSWLDNMEVEVSEEDSIKLDNAVKNAELLISTKY